MSRRSSRSHPTRTPRPQWLLAGAVAIAAGEAFLIVHLVRVPPASSQPVKQALSITTTLPAWRATGVPLVVHGYGGVAVRLALRANGRTVATGLTDGQGRYTLRFTPTKPGRYALAVVGDLSREGVGTLVVRPVVIEAVGDITFGEQVGQYGATLPLDERRADTANGGHHRRKPGDLRLDARDAPRTSSTYSAAIPLRSCRSRVRRASTC